MLNKLFVLVFLLPLQSEGFMLGIDTFSHTILRPTVPYEMGVRLIHTPETLLLLRTPPDGLTLFRIKEPADAPQHIKCTNYTYVRFDICNRLNSDESERDDLSVRMLTNRCDESHFAILHKETPICTMAFKAKALGVGGHLLEIDGSYYGEKCVLDLWKAQMFVVIMGLTMESAWTYVQHPHEPELVMGKTAGKYSGGGTLATEDFFLKLYRKRVMRLAKKK